MLLRIFYFYVINNYISVNGSFFRFFNFSIINNCINVDGNFFKKIFLL
jgi:hypothetical protein